MGKDQRDQPLPVYSSTHREGRPGMTTKAYITPELLRWAREREGLIPLEAAQRLHVSLELWEEWESGYALPTLRQAEELANRLNVPLGYLFLSEPRTERLPIPDIRTMADETPAAPSVDLRDVVNDVLLKQEWYRDYQESEGAEPLRFIKSFSEQDDPVTVASDIRKTIGINEVLRQEAHGLDEYLRKLILRIEAVGILVLRSRIVYNNVRRPLDHTEFRGFAISDPFAPLIFINGRDAKAAQVFTLAHELAHLWIGSTGISNPDQALPSQRSNETERYCNRVAAETLVPAADFQMRWSSTESLQNNLEHLSDYYRVSTLVILRRAYELQQITYDAYHEAYKVLAARRPSAPSNSGGGDPFVNFITRNGRTFTAALIAAVREGSIPYRDAARMLHVKVDTIGGIAKKLFEMQSAANA
jgi:Zn-dependent peptidase ImmA (M78 family)